MSFRPATKDFRQNVQLTDLTLISTNDCKSGPQPNRPFNVSFYTKGGIYVAKSACIVGNLDVGMLCGNITTDLISGKGNGSQILVGGNLVIDPSNWLFATTSCVDRSLTNTLAEKDTGEGIIIEGDVCLTNGELSVDTINEKTVDNGVTIDGVLLKDGMIFGNVQGNMQMDVVVTGNNLVVESLDLTCGNISNVQAIFVDQVFGKNSPVNFEDNANFLDDHKITFVEGIQIGDDLTTTAFGSGLAVGKGANGSGANSVAIGNDVVAGVDAISIGQDISVSTAESILIGKEATIIGSHERGIVIGSSSPGGSGPTINSTGGYSIAIGSASYVGAGPYVGGSAVSAIAFGCGSGSADGPRATATQGVAIGARSVSSGLSSFSINGGNASGTRSVSFMALSEAGAESVAIGLNARAVADHSIAIGYHAGRIGGMGQHCIGIGEDALLNTVGIYNIGLGYNAGNFIGLGTDNVCIGTGADVITATDSSAIAIGDSALAGDSAIAIGNAAQAPDTDQVSIGTESPTSTTANATVWGQTFQSRTWDDATNTVCGIDPDGNLYKTSFNVSNLGMGGGGVSGDITVDSIDVNCGNISNVNALFVGNLFGKSPINVHDTLNILDTASGGSIVFEDSIQIDGVATGGPDAIAIGKSSTAPGARAISIGSGGAAQDGVAIGNNTSTAQANSVAIGVNSSTLQSNNTCVGPNTVCSASNGVAIGSGVNCNRASTVMLGTVGQRFVAFETVTNATQGTSLTTSVIAPNNQGRVTLTSVLAAGASTRFTVINGQVQTGSLVFATVDAVSSNDIGCSVGVTNITNLGFDLIVTNLDTVNPTTAAPRIQYFIYFPDQTL